MNIDLQANEQRQSTNSKYKMVIAGLGVMVSAAAVFSMTEQKDDLGNHMSKAELLNVDMSNLEVLPPLGGDINSVTFSGWSSGSFTSHQLHVAYSQMIKAVGLHAGGIDLLPGGPFIDEYLGKIKTLEDRGLIDPLKNLEDSPVFISSGSNDTTVPRVWQEAQRDFYHQFDADVNFTKTKNSHCFPVDRKVSDEWPL